MKWINSQKNDRQLEYSIKTIGMVIKGLPSHKSGMTVQVSSTKFQGKINFSFTWVTTKNGKSENCLNSS